MDPKMKKWITAAVVLILLGIIATGGVLASCDWEIEKLSTVVFETVTHPVDEAFRHITVETDTADIRFVPSETGECKVVCHEAENEKHVISVNDDMLNVRLKANRKWYEYIGIRMENSTVTVYMPAGAYGDLFVESSTSDVEIPEAFSFEDMTVITSTGDVLNSASAEGVIQIQASTGHIGVEHVSAHSLVLKTSTGAVSVSDAICTGVVSVHVSTGRTVFEDVTCTSLLSSGNTGDIALVRAHAADDFRIERSTGDVYFENCDAGDIFIKTSTGDVRGSLLTGKQFDVRTDTGSVEVPDAVSSGRCEIVTDTGDIRISISDEFAP